MPKLYDPQIPPERVIEAQLFARLQERAKRVTRGPGDVYVLTCTCGITECTRNHLVISSVIARFEEVHRDCPAAAA